MISALFSAAPPTTSRAPYLLLQERAKHWALSRTRSQLHFAWSHLCVKTETTAKEPDWHRMDEPQKASPAVAVWATSAASRPASLFLSPFSRSVTVNVGRAARNITDRQHLLEIPTTVTVCWVFPSGLWINLTCFKGTRRNMAHASEPLHISIKISQPDRRMCFTLWSDRKCHETCRKTQKKHSLAHSGVLFPLFGLPFLPVMSWLMSCLNFNFDLDGHWGRRLADGSQVM